MYTELFSPKSRRRLRTRAGPLGPHIEGFADRLTAQGYAPFTVRLKLRTVGDLGAWLHHQGLAVEALDERRVAAFLQTRDAKRRSRRGEAATCRGLLDDLRDSGWIAAVPPDLDDEGPTDRIVRTYERFLVHVRGLALSTVVNYVAIALAFLADRFGTGPVELERLGARDANQFVLRESRRLSRSRTKLVVTALRSFLRHLYQRGDLAADLSSAVLPVMHWRLSGLPKAIEPEQVEALLASCDPHTAGGRRDRAILLLLARLGLRAGEAAALTLDDFDWNAGAVTVPGKGLRREALPLPRDVGEAVAEYLRSDRPQCTSRRLFIRMRAPHRGFGSRRAIGDVVKRALARAGLELPRRGAHLLRHALATGMLRRGATLEEIGRVLRHRHPDTTWIYAKVDLEALRTVAPAWPAGGVE